MFLKSRWNYLLNNFYIFSQKNHPKLYLWAEPWKKPSLPGEKNLSDEIKEVDDPMYSNIEELNQNSNQELNVEANESMLLSFLKGSNESKDLLDIQKLDLDSLIEGNLQQIPENVPRAPQPEARIDFADCRLNLLKHINESQELVKHRIADIVEQIKKLEICFDVKKDKDSDVTMKQTMQMLARDADVLKEFSDMATY